MYFNLGINQCYTAIRYQIGEIFVAGKSFENDPGLKNGLNIVNGKIVFPAVAENLWLENLIKYGS